MDAETTKAMIRRYHEETRHKGNWAFVDEFLSPDYAGWDATTGEKISREDMKGPAEGYTNLHIDILDILVEGDRAAFRWISSGKDPQGNPFKFVGFSMYTFKDGKVVEDHFMNAPVKGE
jgi:hypothetical protein